MRPFLSAHTYPVLLMLLSIGILAGGVLLKPEKANTELVVSESESWRLQQLAQKKSLEDMTAFFARVAGEAGRHVVYVRQANGAGIVWNNQGEIVTAGIESPDTSDARAILPDGREVPARLRPSGAPVAAATVPKNSAVTAVTPAVAAPGAWVVQVGRRPDGSVFYTPGISRGVRPVTCLGTDYQEIDTSIELTRSMAGGGLFDLDGRVLGIVAPCGDRTIVLRAAEVERALKAPANAAGAVEKHWGIKLAPLDDAARKFFRSEAGALVRELDTGGLAARSGIATGDVVLAFNGEAVDSPETFDQLSATETEKARVTILRRGRKRVVAAAGPVKNDVADIGVRLERPPEGYLIEAVAPDSPAGRAGVRPGDRLLEVNGVKARPAEDFGAALTKHPDRPLYLLVSRGAWQVGILLP